MSFTSTLHDFAELANVRCSSTNSARSASLSGFVLPRLRPGSMDTGWTCACRPSRACTGRRS